MKKILLLCAILTLLSGCTDPTKARHVLHQNGFRDIEITGYRYGMGGEGDFYVTGFRATSPAGVVVTGAVCSGLLKGATIRFD